MLWQRPFVFIFFSLFCAPFLGLLAGEGGSLAVGVWLWRLAVAFGVWYLAFGRWPMPFAFASASTFAFAFALFSFRFGCMYLIFFRLSSSYFCYLLSSSFHILPFSVFIFRLLSFFLLYSSFLFLLRSSFSFILFFFSIIPT